MKNLPAKAFAIDQSGWAVVTNVSLGDMALHKRMVGSHSLWQCLHVQELFTIEAEQVNLAILVNNDQFPR